MTTWGSGFRVQGLGFRVWGKGFKVREKVKLDVARRIGDSLSPSLPKQRPSSISTHIISRNLTRFFKDPKIE